MKPRAPWKAWKTGEFERWFDWHIERQRQVFARLDRLRAHRCRQRWMIATAYAMAVGLLALVVLVYWAEYVGGVR